MKKSFSLLVLFLSALWSCTDEDYGPIQEDKKSYTILDFDRIDASDGLDVTVIHGNLFSVVVSGDRRNLNEMMVTKSGTTLQLKYNSQKKRQYKTYVVVTMPALLGADFSGAVNARASGFTDASLRFDLALSGASTGQFELNPDETNLILSGASVAILNGKSKKMDASVSGASMLEAFDYVVDQAQLVVSGASKAKVDVSTALKASASGASEIIYNGDPEIDSDASGASNIGKN